jgi:protein-L-isoaspartate(D-aspartate) O-methyltransferase
MSPLPLPRTAMTALDDIEKHRYLMIQQQIRPWDVLDPAVLSLLERVKREAFLPPALAHLAFVDMELPLTSPAERAHATGQSMLPPKTEARLVQDVEPQGSDRVLLVGVGSGYLAALLGALTQRVIGFEIEAALAEQARHNLRAASASNVEVRTGSGAQGAPSEGPFDLIVLAGSVAQAPQALLQQLKVGGRLGAVIGQEPIMRFTVVRRTSDTQWVSTALWDTVAPRLRDFAEPSRFAF